GQSRHRQDQIAVGQYLDRRYGQFRRNERGLGRLGFARQHAGACHRRGQIGHAGLQGRDHGGRGAFMTESQGILAIFNDCRPGREAEFEEWFQGEHLLERLAVPGFLFGRRHQAISGSNGYFNFYLAESPAVLTSKPYLERLDNPTPMTKKIMSEVFINMNRTVCHRTLRAGGFRGAYAVTVRFNDAPDNGTLTALAEMLVQDAAVAACEIWTAVDPAG